MIVQGLNRRKTIADCVMDVKVISGQIMPKQKRNPRKAETQKRIMAEKVIEKDIIFALNLIDGVTSCKSGESSEYNSMHTLDGMSDIMVFIEKYGVIFMECKQPKYRNTRDGGLRPSQVFFRDLCFECKLEYVVVYTIKEAIDYVNKICDKL